MVSSKFFPFYPLGFRCNPFRALTDEEWVEVAVIPPQLQQVLNNGRPNLQILGEKGYGKTTLLLWLAAQKTQSGHRTAYERIPEDGRTFHTPLTNLDHFLLDEAQRLTKRERQRLFSNPSTHLILASHENLAPLFAAHNRPLTTIELDQTTPAHLQAVLNRRLTYFALPDHPPAAFSQEAIQHLWQKFGRNLRATEQYLYEQFQQLLTDDPSPDWFNLPD